MSVLARWDLQSVRFFQYLFQNRAQYLVHFLQDAGDVEYL